MRRGEACLTRRIRAMHFANRFSGSFNAPHEIYQPPQVVSVAWCRIRITACDTHRFPNS